MNMQIHKELAYGQFQKRIREGQVIIPKTLPFFDEVVKQLKAYVWKEGVTGVRGDDLVDAIVLSCYDEFLDVQKLDWNKQTGGCAGPWPRTDHPIQTNRKPKQVVVFSSQYEKKN